MKVLGKIIKAILVFFIVVIVFNRISPYFLEKKENSIVEISEPKNEVIPQEATLPNEMGVVKARPIEYGQWLIYFSDDDAILEKAFNELGMLTCEPEFELFLKYKINELLPDINLEEALIEISPDCDGEYEMRVKDKEIVPPVFEFLIETYQSKETINAASADFKSKVKDCLSGTNEMSSYICRELERKPLPTPEPRYFPQDGKVVPMKGFSECYDKIISRHQGEFTPKVIQDAESACYSSW